MSQDLVKERMSDSTAPSDHYLPSLDGWRAIAITLVILSHWWASEGGQVVASHLQYFTNQGDLGVRIFFVISGFLITLLLLREFSECGNISLGKFYARRALRIFPVYFAFLSTLVILTVIGFYTDDASSWLGSLTFTRNVLGQGRSATGHLWSLAVEEQFYLLWPVTMIAFGLVGRGRRALLVLSIIVVLAFMARLISCETNSVICLRILGAKSAIKYADCLAIGCAAAYLFTYKPNILPSSQLVFFAAFVGLAISTVLYPVSKLGVSSLILAQALLTAICLVASITTKPAGFYTLLNCPIATGLGLMSYSIYIWHPLFLLHYMGDRFAGGILYDWKLWSIAALATAAISYRFFERPIARIRRRFRPDGVAAPPPSAPIGAVSSDT
jgi:peptidoglycan/LPS O-acetylase OafA/YrhL